MVSTSPKKDSISERSTENCGCYLRQAKAAGSTYAKQCGERVWGGGTTTTTTTKNEIRNAKAVSGSNA